MPLKQTRIVIIEYDHAWPSLFEALRTRVHGALGEMAITIEHVGSTAVPGLAAKPIVDIDVVISSLDDLPIVIARLEALGYVYQGDLGICGREAFLAPPSQPQHHLYVCPVDGEELRRHRAFRDHLQAHLDVAALYATSKKDAARRFPEDIVAYVAAKSQFIENVLSANIVEYTAK